MISTLSDVMNAAVIHPTNASVAFAVKRKVKILTLHPAFRSVCVSAAHGGEKGARAL